MPALRTGRPLDDTGDPIDEPALELDPDGIAAELFANSPHALASSPGLGMWASLLSDLDNDESDAPAMLVWLHPDATTLPEHVHHNGTETFRALRGELTVVVDGESRRLSPGEECTVRRGEPHYFSNTTDDYVAFRVTVPWTKTIETQYATFGKDHEGVFGTDGGYGEPDFIHGLLLSEYVSSGTEITVAPQVVQRVLWATIGRAAKAMGRSAVDERYLRDEYWRTTVEQPDI